MFQAVSRVGLSAVALAALACGGPSEELGDVAVESSAFTTRCGTSSQVVHGIDASKWQGEVDWPAVRGDGNDFAIVRTTHGIDIIDEYFDRNWREVQAAGMIRGTYQFYEPGQDPIRQADIMLDMIDAAGGMGPEDLPPVLDLEVDGGLPPSGIIASALTWLEYVEQQTGKRPMIYSAGFFGDQLGDALADYPLWVANYTGTHEGNCPKVPDGWTSWAFWQYTDSGVSSGTTTNTVDLNVFDGSLDDLRAFALASNVGAPGTGGMPGAGGTPGTGAVPGTGGAGGEPPVGTGGTSGAPTGVGGAGATTSGTSGCTFAPDCGQCGTCWEQCLCESGQADACFDVCLEPEEGLPTTQATTVTNQTEGCACRAAGNTTPGGAPLLMLAALVALGRRRRR